MFGFFSKKVKIQEQTIKEVQDYRDVKPIAEYFHSQTGISFDKQMSILKSKAGSFSSQRNIPSFEKLLKSIKSDESLRQELIDYLTTNETFFYREFKQIKELVGLVKNSDSNVDILCSPCSTGEEAYSIAIALLEAKIPASRFKILGIDINSQAIQKAKLARYSQRNMRNLSSSIVSRYFTKEQEKFHLKDNVKSIVSFKIANLFDDSFKELGKFDFVFSRNMLIYFDKETKQKARKILEEMRKEKKYSVFFGHADLF